MALKDQLTSERLRKRFKSPFDLVNYSIKLAKDMIQTGRGCRIDTSINNKAYQILLEIAEDKDKFSLPQESDEELS